MFRFYSFPEFLSPRVGGFSRPSRNFFLGLAGLYSQIYPGDLRGLFMINVNSALPGPGEISNKHRKS